MINTYYEHACHDTSRLLPSMSVTSNQWLRCNATIVCLILDVIPLRNVERVSSGDFFFFFFFFVSLRRRGEKRRAAESVSSQLKRTAHTRVLLSVSVPNAHTHTHTHNSGRCTFAGRLVSRHMPFPLPARADANMQQTARAHAAFGAGLCSSSSASSSSRCHV